MIEIAVFSQEFDIHALAIVSALRKRRGVRVHFLATDACVTQGGLRWSPDGNQAELKSLAGEWIQLPDQDLVWWRRVNQPQKALEELVESELKDFINNEWRSSLLGIAHDSVRGVWVNIPMKEALAGNKLIQLAVAQEFGFRVPRTLVTQDYEAVLNFRDEVACPIIAKKLMGTRHAPLATVELDFADLTPSSVSLCPAIYQERIDSSTHLRVNCFGNDIHTFLIESRCMDWRRDMEGPFDVYELDGDTVARLMQMLEHFDLEMGVFDFVLLADGSLVWLELNTQGQFLFGEGKAQYDLTNPFCDFLIDRAERGRT